MKRRLLTLMLAAALCLGLAAPALAAGEAPVSGSCGQYTIWTFDQSTGTLTISGKGAVDDVSMRPGYAPWVNFLQEIRTVVIEEGVTYIGADIFANCANLTRVTIPKSVTDIGPGAFTGTLWLKSLGELAIANNILIKYQGSAEKVVIPKGVTIVAAGAFVQDKTLVEVVIPEGVTSLGSSAFLDCDNLAKITFPSTLRSVGPNCFTRTKWLEEQKGDFILAGPVLLKYRGEGGDVTIPEGVTDVEDAAFTWSSWFPFGEDLELGTLTVPASMRNLNVEYGFYNSFPKSVAYKGSWDQWNKIEGTQWLTENKIPVRCTGLIDPAQVFTDMEPRAFYLDAVAWAVANGVTYGKTATTFAPWESCTHGQILTFLWRAAGSPASSVILPFATTGKEYYLGAAKWAYDKGMIGASFTPDAACTRADAVRYIWQAMGSPYARYDGRFTDISANSPYAQAVAWAVKAGVTTGATATTFNPNSVCNRGQIVTFLYRAYK